MVKNTQDTHRSEGRGTAEGIPAGVNLSKVLPKLVSATVDKGSPKQAMDEIRTAGITADDLKGVSAYLTYLRPGDLDDSFGAAAKQEQKSIQLRYDEALEDLRFVAAAASVPGWSAKDNETAARTTEAAQNHAGASIAKASIDTALAERLAAAYGFTASVISQLLGTSQGNVWVPEGSARELHWKIDVTLPDGSTKTFSGQVENTAGMSGRHEWSGGVKLPRLIDANNPQQ